MVALRLLRRRNAPPIHQRRFGVRDVWAVSERISRDEFIAEFEWTRPRHHGKVTEAAKVFDLSVSAMTQRLRRAKRSGVDVKFVDDTKAGT
jgi:hypothetical protein